MKKLLVFLLALALAVGMTTGLALAEAERDTITIGVTNVIDKVDPTYGGDPWSLTADGISERIIASVTITDKTRLDMTFLMDLSLLKINGIT